jgi:hypothetical protein
VGIKMAEETGAAEEAEADKAKVQRKEAIRAAG